MRSWILVIVLVLATMSSPVADGSQASQALAVKAGTVQVGDDELYFEMKGEGRPVILLHGGLLDCTMWDEQFELLARNHQVVRYDSRGHGRSSPATADHTAYGDLHQVMAFLDIDSAVLVGLSLGGRVALDFAIAHPEMVDGIVAVAPGVSGWKFVDPVLLEHQKEQQKAAQAEDLDAYVEWFMRSWTDGPRRTPEEVDPAVRERVRKMARATLEKVVTSTGRTAEIGALPRLAEIKAPILAIVGDEDMSDIHGIVDTLVEKTGATKLLIPGAGHMVNLEKPAELNRAVLQFLASLDEE